MCYPLKDDNGLFSFGLPGKEEAMMMDLSILNLAYSVVVSSREEQSDGI